MSATLSRRAFLLASQALAGCSSCPSSGPPRGNPADVDPGWRTLRFPPTTDTPEGQEALVLAVAPTPRPMLIALHGRGEAGRGLAVGAHGWRDDYDLDRMRAALKAPPIDAGAVGSFETGVRLEAVNRSLASHSFEDLTVVCPYTPIVTRADAAGAAPFARFVTDVLIPTSEKEVGAPAPLPRAIDGVSMGGRLALLVGFAFPDRFASIGALQPALSPDEADTFADLAVAALEKARFALRLVSSEDDPFLDAVRALDAALTARGVDHGLVVTPGPHDYAWNRGPGALEMLIHHERVLRGLPAP